MTNDALHGTICCTNLVSHDSFDDVTFCLALQRRRDILVIYDVPD